ncbi:MAG: FAD-dependent oxidoreductase, partial [Bacillota bacterium]|nr:FAD-dependent oxidoreductase [Bacillota bacterium]
AVIGIDKQPGAGGMGTYGYVSGYYYGAAGGLHVGLDQEAEALARTTFVDTVEAKKYLLEKKAMAAGATFLFSARLIGVYLEADVVRGVAVWTNGRLIRIACDLAIDATAEAELCRAAGCAIEFGRASDGQVRPFTSVKVWLNDKGQIARTNHDSGYVDQQNPYGLSDGICSAHENQLLDSFHEDRMKVLFLAPMIGIREGCRIVSHNNITMQAILDGDFDPEPLFYAYADFDKHGKDHALESEQMLDWYVACNLSTACLSVSISARSLVPQELTNVIAAGRHIGVDHDTASLVRMKRDMHKCGEAAGVLAALAVQSGVRPLDVPYADVRAILSQSGCLNPEHHVGVWFDDSYRRHKIEWLHDPADIRQALSTDKPGIALYSCKLLGNKITQHLKGWLADPDPMLASNSALALGLLGRNESLPVLRRIVQNRDSFYFKDCRRTNQLRTAMAIYLIGKCADSDGMPLLREILCDPEEYKKPLYSDIQERTYAFSLTKNFNEVYFQIVSQAAMAVVRIMRKNPRQMSTGATILEEAFQTDRHIVKTTTMPEGTYEYATMANVRDYVLDYAAKAMLT